MEPNLHFRVKTPNPTSKARPYTLTPSSTQNPTRKAKPQTPSTQVRPTTHAHNKTLHPFPIGGAHGLKND